MYGIYTHIWVIFRAHVGKQIHISQLGLLFPIYDGKKHVPNHQPDKYGIQPVIFPQVSGVMLAAAPSTVASAASDSAAGPVCAAAATAAAAAALAWWGNRGWGKIFTMENGGFNRKTIGKP
jgi:hypothetical protein